MEESITFAYQVNTRMPITGLSIGNLRSPKTVELTKEDVLICVKKAPVFRRFTTGKLVRVGTANLDRLHNEEYIDEKDWEAYLDKRGTVNEAPVKEEAPVVEEKKETPVVEEPVKVEETVEETVESKTEEAAETLVEAQTEESVEDSTDEINEEEVSEEVTENNEASKEEEKGYNNNNNRYNNKKKHNR